MAQQYKVEKVEQLKGYFNENKFYIFSNFAGLNVEKITSLRRQLRKVNSNFVVMKNNYIRKILPEDKTVELKAPLFGPTAVAFAKDDVSEVLKVLFNFTKDSTLAVKGGWGEDRSFSAKDLEALSKLPSRKELLAHLLATMKAPIQNFTFACNDVVTRFVRVCNAVKATKSN